MERRHCCFVIAEMITKIPEGNNDFIKDLNWNYEDASYKAPEETLQWERTARTLQTHIPNPTEDWQFEILSIFTTKSVSALKAEVAEFNKNE